MHKWSQEQVDDLKRAFYESFTKQEKSDGTFISEQAFQALVEAYDESYEPDNIFDEELKYEAIEEAKKIYEKKDQGLVNLVNAFKLVKDFFTDSRESGKVIYPIYVVVIVMLLARMQGIKSSTEIAEFYNQKNIVLQLLIPGMPSPENIISAQTINNIRALISQEETEQFFSEFFGTMCMALETIVTFNDEKYKEDREGTLETYGFDGQEMRSSFRRGATGRRAKGAVAVTLMNCTQRTAVAFVNKGVKNQERSAFLQMIEDTDIKGKVVMCDAINTSEEVTSAITNKGAYFLMPIKKCQSNTELLNHVKANFNRQNAASNTLTTSFTFKEHGRVETSTIEILPAEKYIDPMIKNPHKGIATLVKYTKETLSIRSQKTSCETRYYISSLPYEEEKTLKQVKASIVDYWMIETHHNVIDTSSLAQDSFQGCNPRTLSLEVALNKAVYNITTKLRNDLSSSKNKPLSYEAVMRRMREISLKSLFKILFNDYLMPKYNPSDNV